MGSEKNTPDSVIRPTVLMYKGTKSDRCTDVMAHGKLPPTQYHLTIIDDNNTFEQNMTKSNRSEADIAANLSTASSSPKTDLTTQIVGRVAPSKSAAPVIQNGTLAAASALMTLFGIEKSLAE